MITNKQTILTTFKSNLNAKSFGNMSIANLLNQKVTTSCDF